MRVLSTKIVYECPVFTVVEEEAIEPGGKQVKRSIVQHRGSAVILAVDDRNRILLVRQYRLAVRQPLWELPAGRIDPTESPLMAARRELQEETGYTARVWKRIFSFYPSPGYVSERMTLFLARDLSRGEAQPAADEVIYTRWFTEEEIEQSIRQGKIVDAKTLIGYWYWKNSEFYRPTSQAAARQRQGQGRRGL